MRFRQVSTVFIALSAAALAQKPKPAPAAVAATPATPAKSSGPAKAPAIISSEMGGRDLVFVANALDLGNALSFLAAQAAKTSNPNLQEFGANLSQMLVAHEAVLDTLAEMRNIKPPKESPTTKKLAAKLGALEGLKLEKGILNAFIEVEERMVATYQLGTTSSDVTIAKFVEQGLPQAEQHLALVQQMAGIAPKRPPGEFKPQTEIAVNVPAKEPTIRSADAPAPTAAPEVAAPPVTVPPKPAIAIVPDVKPPASEPMPPKPAVAVAEVKEQASAPTLPPPPKPVVAEVPEVKTPIIEKPVAPSDISIRSHSGVRIPILEKPIAPPAPEKTAVVVVPPPAPAKVKEPAPLPPKPEPIAEPPIDVAPKVFEGETPKPAKRPTFRMNVKPVSE